MSPPPRRADRRGEDSGFRLLSIRRAASAAAAASIAAAAAASAASRAAFSSASRMIERARFEALLLRPLASICSSSARSLISSSAPRAVSLKSLFIATARISSCAPCSRMAASARTRIGSSAACLATEPSACDSVMRVSARVPDASRVAALAIWPSVLASVMASIACWLSASPISSNDSSAMSRSIDVACARTPSSLSSRVIAARTPGSISFVTAAFLTRGSSSSRAAAAMASLSDNGSSSTNARRTAGSECLSRDWARKRSSSVICTLQPGREASL